MAEKGKNLRLQVFAALHQNPRVSPNASGGGPGARNVMFKNVHSTL